MAPSSVKSFLRPHVERILRSLPVSRVAFAERDALAAQIRALAPALSDAGGAIERPSVVWQIGAYDPHHLEEHVSPTRTLEERIAITTRCRDADVLPRVANAGTVTQQEDGSVVQIMHNGIKVLAGGYYGRWMQDLIMRCKGVHEPQEEVVFAEMMRHLPQDGTMIELGGFWSYYSIWFLHKSGGGRHAIVVEPDPAHIEIGRTNARLNGCEPKFVQAFAGRQSGPSSLFTTEQSGEVILPCVSVTDLMASHGLEYLDVLHCDAQGVEFDILESCQDLAAAGRLGWVVVSTHSHQISGDPLTHQRCLALLHGLGANILVEHDVQESFSGDGLIVAKFGLVPGSWQMPQLSYNRYSESLLRNPLYDLASARREARWSPAGLVANSKSLALRGALVTITANCSLGDAGDSLAVPFDRMMYPATVACSGWAEGMLEFIQRRIDRERRYVVLDIGANIGLFTRQISLRLPNLTRFLCVEAELGNFRVLQYNVGQLLGNRAVLWNVALSDRDGEAEFFRDAENIGNYSLNDDAMRDRPFDTIAVRCVATDRWMLEYVRPAAEERLIWKSDTQGHDELIISVTPMEVWDRIEVAVVALWRIKKPDFDQEAFCRRLDGFANKSIGGSNHNTTAEILEFLQGNDWQHDDLYLWR
jgi:FkbM family methyltransferase